VEVARIAEGLWRWAGRLDAIGADVACVYQEGVDGVVLIDPLIPREDEARFLAALDRDVARAGGEGVHVLTTVDRHGRSSRELAARYGATVWRNDRTLPNGIVAVGTGLPGEVAFWLPTHRCLVCGDVVRGSGGRLVVGEVSSSFARTVVGLGVERVLVAHGAPVLERAGEVLRDAFSPVLEP
jgi:glyoxylase-like metal-dependent hydrolase (beta-lactamase superfamily II)